MKRGHGHAARRVRGTAKCMFDYALSQRLARANPAATIKTTHIRHFDYYQNLPNQTLGQFAGVINPMGGFGGVQTGQLLETIAMAMA